MIKILCLVLLAGAASKADPTCYNGWVTYKDELCITAFNEVLTYQEAKEFCVSQGDDTSKASLVMVKEPAVQEFLEQYTEDIFDYVWLGAKYDNNASQFRWEDKDPVVYTNWGEGYPKNITNGDACLELRPLEAKSLTDVRAKWAHVTCRKRNLVMCQKALSWSLQDAVGEIIKNRKKLEEDQKRFQSLDEQLVKKQQEIDELQRQLKTQQDGLASLRSDLVSAASKIVPVGSVYVEYYNQPSPRTIWPTYTWQDVSGAYAGLFFRVAGGSSGSWGSVQTECAPRITQMSYEWRRNQDYANPLSIPANGWSGYGKSGENDKAGPPEVREGIRFHTSGCEVRPKNQAVRIWRRTA